MFETLIWNSLDDNITRTNVDRFNYGPYSRSSADWELYEKNYTMYPFFKKWMIRNNIDNLYNTDYDPNDWKTWNYRTIDADSQDIGEAFINLLIILITLYLNPGKL